MTVKNSVLLLSTIMKSCLRLRTGHPFWIACVASERVECGLRQCCSCVSRWFEPDKFTHKISARRGTLGESSCLLSSWSLSFSNTGEPVGLLTALTTRRWTKVESRHSQGPSRPCECLYTFLCKDQSIKYCRYGRIQTPPTTIT